MPYIGSDIARVEPFLHTRGGFFACLADTRGGARIFAKCILSRGREARFWRTWRDGGIRAEGARYRLLPPDHAITGPIATVLFFPAHPALPITGKRRIAAYAKHAHLAVRALADFNSDHMDPALVGPFAGSGASGPPRAARPRALERTYGFDRDTSLAAAADLRAARNAWPAATAGLDTAPRCLCHLDLGRGNVIFERGKATILDFGHAAIAPAGADLHTVLRYTRADGSRRNRFAEIYAAEFARKDVEIDPDLVRLAMEARYAARYTDPGLPGARRRSVFLSALRTARTLAERTDSG